MDIGTFSRKERLLKLREELVEVEESRASGSNVYTIEELDDALSRTIDGIAELSNRGDYTTFTFGGTCIRFKAPYSLERYLEVKEWDHGYIVVDAKYSHSSEPVEEYIDLVPILEDLYMDADKFLSEISNVIVSYE